MKIGKFELKNNLILAPMAGVTDLAFRSICIDAGADYAVSEMVSAKALTYGNKKTFDLLQVAPNEKIKVLQLFGSEKESFAKALKIKEVQAFDIIDINMGCPTPKIVNNGAGSDLMRDMDRAREIIETCVANTNQPVTVKFRAGWNEESINAVEFAKMCEKAGAAAICVHARTREQFYSGVSDWNLVKLVKESVSIPVIASGDVVDKESYDKIKEITHCDAVMIGRGALGNPQIFSEVRGEKFALSTYEQVVKHIEILRGYYSDYLILKHMRKHFLWYLKSYRNSKSVKVEIVSISTIEKALQRLKKFFDEGV